MNTAVAPHLVSAGPLPFFPMGRPYERVCVLTKTSHRGFEDQAVGVGVGVGLIAALNAS
jgi:hypothetical protein